MNTLIYNGKEISINTKGLFKVINYTSNNKINLQRVGHFSKRKKPISQVVLHHGGFDVFHLAAVLMDPERKVSTHLGIGFSKDNPGEIIVAQYMDLENVAWHCAGYNDASIGIDFAVQPGVEHNHRYNLPVIANPSSIGPRKVVEFPDALLEAALVLIEELHRITAIPTLMKLAPAADAKLEASTIKAQGITVYGHHHVSTSGKFDVSYIWERLVRIRGRGNVC